MLTKLNSIHLPLTRSLCDKFAKMTPVPGEVPLRESHVKLLREKFERGLFHDPNWASVIFDGVEYRINGQHSSNMLCGLNGNFPAGMNVTIHQYQATSNADLALAFEQYDNPDCSRDKSERCGAYKMLSPELVNIANTSIKKSAEAIRWYQSTVLGVKFTEEDTRLLIAQQAPAIAFMSLFCGTPRMGRKGVLAAMFATFRKDKTAASEFWRNVCDSSHPDVNNPSRLLGSFLANPGRNKKCDRSWSQSEFCVKCLLAWNAYREGRGTNLQSTTLSIPELK